MNFSICKLSDYPIKDVNKNGSKTDNAKLTIIVISLSIHN